MKYPLTLILLFAGLFSAAQTVATPPERTAEDDTYQLRRQVYGGFTNDINLDKYVFDDHALVVFQNGYVMMEEEFLHAFYSTRYADSSLASKTKFLHLFIQQKQKVFEAMDLGLDTGMAFKLQFLKFKQEYVTPYLNEGYSRVEAEALPEFKYFMREFYDGMIVAALMDKEIWTKSNLDNTALRKFYNEHLDLYQGQSFETSRTKVIHDYQLELEKQLEEKIALKFPYRINNVLLKTL